MPGVTTRVIRRSTSPGAPPFEGGTLTCSGVDRFSGIGVSGVYTLGPGVTANLGGFYGRYRGNNYNAGSVVDAALTATATGKTNAAQNNDGGGVLGGILIRF